MISLRSSLEKLSAGARVIFGVAALLENTPFELYTLIRSGSLIQLQAATRKAIQKNPRTDQNDRRGIQSRSIRLRNEMLAVGALDRAVSGS